MGQSVSVVDVLYLVGVNKGRGSAAEIEAFLESLLRCTALMTDSFWIVRIEVVVELSDIDVPSATIIQRFFLENEPAALPALDRNPPNEPKSV
jgi:hypothetical protein